MIATKETNTKERAAYWGASIRVMQKLIRAGVPVDSDEAMKSWYATLSPDQQNKLSPGIRSKIVGVRKALESDADYKAFEEHYSAESGDKSVLADLKKQLAFYMFKHRAASEKDDGVGASEAMRQIKELASVVHDSELRGQKLGRDMGDLVPRSEMENIARFLGYNLLKCCDGAIGQLAKTISLRDPGLPAMTEAEVREAAEPLFLTAVVYQPMVRAIEGDHGARPPGWLVDALKAGVEEVVE